jgi:hypothetical protein
MRLLENSVQDGQRFLKGIQGDERSGRPMTSKMIENVIKI